MNKYLEKIAETTGFIQGLREAPPHSKIGLIAGLTGLGLSVANTYGNHKKNDLAETQVKMEEKSLAALNKIHNSLEKLPGVVDPSNN